MLRLMIITSRTYRNVNFWREFVLPNWILQCRIHVLSQHHTISRSIRNQDNDKFCVLSIGRKSLNDEFFIPIWQQYLYDYLYISASHDISFDIHWLTTLGL